MDSDAENELLDIRVSAAALVRVFYRELTTVVLLSIAWSLAALPIVTAGSSTLALCETMTRVITDHSETRLLGERARLGAFADSFQQNLRRGVPLSGLLVALFLSLWVHARIYTLSGQWIFSVSTLVGFYLLVIGTAWTFRAASLLVRGPQEAHLGTIQAFRDGAVLALEYPHYTVLQLVVVTAAFFISSLHLLIIPLLLPATLATIEVIAFEEIVNGAAADIRRYYEVVL